MDERKPQRSRRAYIHFRASEAERVALERLCQYEQMTISDALRLVLREGAQRRGVWPVGQGVSTEVRR